MRKTYIDYMKAIGALLVILSHSISFYSESFKLVPRPIGLVGMLCYAVNASVFFVLAGLLCHRQDLTKFYFKKITKILLPFAVFSLLKVFYTIFLNARFAHADSPAGILKDAFFYGRLYWFPYTLFIIFLLAPLFWHDDGNSSRSGLYISMAGFVISFALVETLSLTGKENAILALQVNNVFKYLPFFLMGMIGSHIDKEKLSSSLRRHMPAKLSLSILLVILSGYLLVRGLPPGDDVRVTWELPYHLRFLMALPLMYIIYAISVLLPQDIGWLSLTGKRSLQILLFDSIFKTVIYAVFIRITEHAFWMIPVETILSIALTVLVCEVIKKVPIVRNLVGV